MTAEQNIENGVLQLLANSGHYDYIIGRAQIDTRFKTVVITLPNRVVLRATLRALVQSTVAHEKTEKQIARVLKAKAQPRRGKSKRQPRAKSRKP